jgi:hypothetical protein
MGATKADKDGYLTIQATPEQAQRLAELGVISETQAQQAAKAGGLFVRLPSQLVADFFATNPTDLLDERDVISTVKRTSGEVLDENGELEKIAHWLEEAGMNAPARLFLSSNRPLSFFGSQILLAAQPITRASFGQKDPTGLWSQLLEKRSNVDKLVNKLEQLEAGRKHKGQK